ncbi:MAG: hypothetical protein RL329_3317 [Bacteroidota bacterium]
MNFPPKRLLSNEFVNRQRVDSTVLNWALLYYILLQFPKKPSQVELNVEYSRIRHGKVYLCVVLFLGKHKVKYGVFFFKKSF